MGKKVNKGQLQEILGVSHQALTDWQKEGLPIEVVAAVRGQQNQYDTEVVIRWLMQREVAKAQARSPRDELDAVKTERERLALRRDQNELVERREMRPLLERYVQDNIAILEGIPDKYAPLLQQTPDLEGKHQLLKEAVREIRTGLGDYEFCVEPAAGGDPAV